MKKIKTSFTLSEEAKRLLALLAVGMGVSRADVIEILIREAAKREGLWKTGI